MLSAVSRTIGVSETTRKEVIRCRWRSLFFFRSGRPPAGKRESPRHGTFRRKAFATTKGPRIPRTARTPSDVSLPRRQPSELREQANRVGNENPRLRHGRLSESKIAAGHIRHSFTVAEREVGTGVPSHTFGRIPDGTKRRDRPVQGEVARRGKNEQSLRGRTDRSCLPFPMQLPRRRFSPERHSGAAANSESALEAGRSDDPSSESSTTLCSSGRSA